MMTTKMDEDIITAPVVVFLFLVLFLLIFLLIAFFDYLFLGYPEWRADLFFAFVGAAFLLFMGTRKQK